jgi:hypothetical protein
LLTQAHFCGQASKPPWIQLLARRISTRTRVVFGQAFFCTTNWF